MDKIKVEEILKHVEEACNVAGVSLPADAIFLRKVVDWGSIDNIIRHAKTRHGIIEFAGEQFSAPRARLQLESEINTRIKRLSYLLR